MLDLLACPACRGRLSEEDDRLVCCSCGRRYPVREGIPVLLVEEAERPEGAT
ncbi:MAG: Trm112 family protein [Armatimonadota bacterium]|nr:Trm112 family protein [Armatimonadota bacterium]MDW8155254.1 Trm112 family protein [Armatimonadota bacterium]